MECTVLAGKERTDKIRIIFLEKKPRKPSDIYSIWLCNHLSAQKLKLIPYLLAIKVNIQNFKTFVLPQPGGTFISKLDFYVTETANFMF